MAGARQALFDSESIAALKRLRKARDQGDVCEMCGRELGCEHPHVVEVASQRIACACDACAFLFEAATGAKYRRIPRDVFRLDDMQIDDVEWESLSIPIGLAFFLASSEISAISAVYPSPGGPVRTEIERSMWDEIARKHPCVREMAPDVEALLVNRLNGASKCYVAPIDRCYELTGLVRKHWSGFSGGDEVWAEVDGFFTRLSERATAVGAADAGSAV